MRRPVCIFAICIVAFSMTTLLTGCGGDGAKAKQYVNEGDRLISSIEDNGVELGSAIEEAFEELFELISQGKAPDTSSFSEQSDRMSSLADEMLVEAESAKAAYGNVEQLDDVPDYEQYAALMIRLVDVNSEGLNQLMDFLEQVEARLTTSPFDAVAFQVFVTEFGESMESIGEEGGRIQEEAQQLKKQKGL